MSSRVGSPDSLGFTKALARGAALLLSFMGASLAAAPTASATPLGTITTFATVPADPGFPEGIAVHGNRVYVAGAAAVGTAGHGPSKIHVYDRRTGSLETSITVAGEDLSQEHALSCIATDSEGRVYGITTQLDGFGPPPPAPSPKLGLLRFSKHGHHYVQESYGDPLPDLPSCDSAPPGADCSPTPYDLPPLGNDVVFDEDGFAYVTDSFQATVFRYAPGGGAPEIWLQSAALAGGGAMPFGVNGIRLDPDREYVYVSVTFSLFDPSLGSIYRIPLVNAPDEADLELVHDYTAGEGPDGFAFGKHGKLYVTLANLNAISVLNPNGAETSRIVSAPGASIPLDGPANIAFNKQERSLFVVNHALLSGDPSHFALLEVFVNDKGDRLDEPCVP